MVAEKCGPIAGEEVHCMTAGPRQITSLKAPPSGFTWDLNARERQVKAQTRTTYYKFTPGGPRADAIDTRALPTLTPGVSRLPSSCEHCGSGLLNAEPPLGEHRRGLVSCGTCGGAVCWLAAPMPSERTPVSHVSITSQASSPTVPDLPRRVISGRFNRGPGCSRACSIAYGHDAVSHEAYGRHVARLEFEGRPMGIVRTGGMTVNLDSAAVLVDGRNAGLTPTELTIVSHLARRIGTVCSHTDILESVWGREVSMRCSLRGERERYMNVLRTNLSRLKTKLGEAAKLIEARMGQGYVLRAEPPIGSDGAS